MIKGWNSSGLGRTGMGLVLTFYFAALPLHASPRKQPALTHVTVVVTDAESHKPLFQARLTLEFRDPQSRRGTIISYSAKTNAEGKYVFSFIPMEPVLLVVTASGHQSFGQRFNITEDNQTLE